MASQSFFLIIFGILILQTVLLSAHPDTYNSPIAGNDPSKKAIESMKNPSKIPQEPQGNSRDSQCKDLKTQLERHEYYFGSGHPVPRASPESENMKNLRYEYESKCLNLENSN